MNTANIKNLNDLPVTNGIEISKNPEVYLIRITDDIEEPFPLFANNFLTLASPGNLLLIRAKQKGGKTFLVCIFRAAYYLGQYLNVKSSRTPGKRFYQIDSEQSKSQLFKILKRFFRMAGLTPFTDNGEGIYYLSELSVDERWEMLETIAAYPDCEVLAVDVVTDFVNDPNDLKETKAAADRLQAIAKKNNIVIICTIHENKDNTHSTGHIGSALEKKSETVLSLEKNNEVFTVKSPYARHGEVDEFSFIIDEHGLPVEAETPLMMTKSERLDIQISQRFKKILILKRLSHTELWKTYSENFGVCESTSKKHITRALDLEVLEIQNNLYQLKKVDNDAE